MGNQNQETSLTKEDIGHRKISLNYFEVAERGLTEPSNDNRSTSLNKLKKLFLIVIPLLGLLALLAWF